MIYDVILGIIMPFVGTILGALCVFVPGKKLGENQNMVGLAGGVMMAASVWSLIIPAVDYSASYGYFSFLPVCIGFWLGVLFIYFVEKRTDREKGDMLYLSVLLHNIPEGMAVGVAYASALSGDYAAVLSAFFLSLGIAIQNFPEGAIISLPAASMGVGKGKAVCKGIISGMVEPVGAFIALVAVTVVAPLMPYVLGFAAGAMIYVVFEELAPRFSDSEISSSGNFFFCIGFSIMMILDIVLS